MFILICDLERLGPLLSRGGYDWHTGESVAREKNGKGLLTSARI